MSTAPDPDQPPTRVVLYQSADGKVTANVLFARDNFWLTQKMMADLFGVKPPAVSKHLKKIFESGELVESAVVSILETTAAGAVAAATASASATGWCTAAGR